MIKITKEQIGNIIREAISAGKESMTYGDKLKEIRPEDIDTAASEMHQIEPAQLKQALNVYADNHPKLREGPARDLFLSFADNPDSMIDAFKSATKTA
tara:strand:+ start:596 stop:889 length:294 start_codon:yes stop_codon:yes gene_type:complete